ncbi:hypothetical protein [Plastoroseomonas hellenica]|uniref:hypothetical protein n=1 Tax=Plastoroseomonas hellenica TaxID=2687306 RepID=UPI001BADB8B9|nr:hypothetical protein [Plastoroseomonas hellenica]MBR0642241.1 hypothetical protein [Plastoroseomonas hellenica]
MMRRRALLTFAVPACAAGAQAQDDGSADILALVELVAGQTPDGTARVAIAEAALAAQHRDPVAQARARRERLAFLEQLRGADAIERARLRIHARGTLWFDWNNADGGVARRAAFALDPVIAVASRSRLVVTEQELSALLAANARAGEVAGITPPPVDRQALTMALAREFPEWPLTRQRGFAVASLRLAQLDRAWQAATAAERDAATRQARQSVRQPQEVPLLARALEAAAVAGRPLSEFGRVVPPLPRIGEQLGIISGMSGALRSFNP